MRKPGRSGTHEGRFWVYLGDEAHPYTVYDCTPNRRRDGPAQFLKDFKGTRAAPRYLQADAYGGYDGIYTAAAVESDANVAPIEVACWAHTRRKFYEAHTSDVVRSHTTLAWIRSLYQVERDAKELSAEAGCTLRREGARPILDDIKLWLDTEHPCVLPKSAIGEAVQYALNRWEALGRYVEDGELEIDNNAAERALRAVAIGRKNWLFAGSDRGGLAAATLYSVVQSAKHHGLDPFTYLRDVFLRLPTHPHKELDALLPAPWKRDILPTFDTPPRL